MNYAVRIITLKIVFFILLCVFQTGSPSAEEKQPQKTQVFKIEQITQEQFKALPDTTVVEFEGKQTTKQKFMAEMEERGKRALERFRTQIMSTSKTNAILETRRTQFLKEEQARIDALNAKVDAEFARLSQGSFDKSQQSEAIQREARQLHHEFKNATPAEQVRIKQRAYELIKQLEQLGH